MSPGSTESRLLSATDHNIVLFSHFSLNLPSQIPRFRHFNEGNEYQSLYIDLASN